MKNKKNFFEVLFLGFLSMLYGIVVSVRNFLYDNKILKSVEFDLPVISIGNISVGGTGKTPHTEYFTNLLKDEFKVAILSQGYKRKTKGFRLVEISNTHYEVGDEPLQLKQKFPEIVVAVCKQRVRGVQKLKELFPDLSVIILDDGFQHRKISPGVSILLNDYNNPIAKDHLLPLGRLRESRSSSQRADIIIYTKCPAELKPIDIRILNNDAEIKPYQYLFFSTLNYLNLIPVFPIKKEICLNDLEKYNVLLVTGIAKSKNLVDFLEKKCNSFSHLSFTDHHNFSKKDVNSIIKKFSTIPDDKIIIVTEKDAVRLKVKDLIPEEIKKFIYYIPIRVELLCNAEEKKQFENQIINYVRNNKTYSKLYKNSYSN